MKKSAVLPTPIGTYEIITPEIAQGWLAKNTSNRGISPSRINEYVDAMKNGKWRTSHEGLAFGADGTLYDGQHRLLAIVKANISVMMHVMRGLSPETRQVIDTGRVRSAADNVAIVEGLHLQKAAASALNVLWMATIAKSVARNANADDLRETLLKHLAGYEAMKHIFNNPRRGLARGGFMAAFIYAYPTAAEKIVIAANKFHGGVGLSKGDPMYVLREYALGTRRAERAESVSDFRRALGLLRGELEGEVRHRITAHDNTPIEEATTFLYFAKAHE